MTANITRPSCRRDCARTWRYEHGASCPGGPFPGTFGSEGDVRRCEHGRIWLYRPDCYHHGSNFDIWRRLTPWGNPILHRRAVRALAEVTQ